MNKKNSADEKTLKACITVAGPEIFIGLIGAVGTDLPNVCEDLIQEFRRVKYQAYSIRLSSLITECYAYKHLKKNNSKAEDERINDLMNAGDDLRTKASRGDAVALLGMSKIRDIRYETHQDSKKPLLRTVYIFNSLKHPEEIKMLRKTYGQAFFVVSVYSPRNKRKENLARIIARSRRGFKPEKYYDKADQLIDKDEKEVGKDLYGQNVRDAFPLGDLFVSDIDGRVISKQLKRFVEILFAHPFKTPTIDEHGMFHAYAASLRSSDLSRQVGSVITTKDGELISSGCNEVPKAGGGAFWEGKEEDVGKDYRDFQVGHDTSARMKHEIVYEVFDRLLEGGWFSGDLEKEGTDALVSKALYDGEPPPLKGTRIASIIEFGRIVHAEMTSITDAARRGLSLRDSFLFCTTFPCHMCARHIIASGIARVVYIEPYPKSMAKELYKKSINVDHDNESDADSVKFESFVGISPLRYLDFFAMPAKRRDGRGHKLDWKPNKVLPRIKQFPTYPEIEASHLDYLDENKIKLGIVSNKTVDAEGAEDA